MACVSAHSSIQPMLIPEPRKSLYFVVTDYFADPPPGQPYSNCSAPGWCNGTLQGITRHLDYIQGMGFEGIWITPAVLQFYGPDPDNRSGYGNYGYWAKDAIPTRPDSTRVAVESTKTSPLF